MSRVFCASLTNMFMVEMMDLGTNLFGKEKLTVGNYFMSKSDVFC